MSLRNAIKQSCDTYFYEVARRLGVDRLNLTAKKLLIVINQLISNEKQLNKMSVASKNLGKPNATKTIVDHIMKITSNV